ncbi:MAG TPA: D-alanyl-D-alanine carboxypeptidase [bacterium]|nr:D-alanyl-D-alanine carboxypeptidase [bacterium]
MIPRRLAVIFGAFLAILAPLSASAQGAWQQRAQGLASNGAILAVDEKGKILFSYNADKPFIPASTLKVPTALAALETLGKGYRFKTDFFIDGNGDLYIKGYGDPFLVSEEFPLIVQALKGKGLSAVRNMVLDGSYFGPDCQVPGLAGSLNPYDAFNGALLANFNTINVVKSATGEVQSAEPQTPVTEITRTLAMAAPPGKSRINVANHAKEAALYPGYLLKEFLVQQGVPVSGSVSLGAVPAGAKPLLAYASSKNLVQVLEPALKFSQNLIMNQLLLTMGAEKFGAPASLAKGKKVLEDYLKSLGLQNFNVEEGSGISRKNYITALEMDKVLVRFFPYYQLLPVKNGMWVKTGTLTGVSSLVGYFQSNSNGWVRFSIILNQPGNQRDAIAQLLLANLQ